MVEDGIRNMKEFVSTQARVFPVSNSKARISLLSYGEKTSKLLPINEGSSVMALRLALNKITQGMGLRYVGGVLAVVRDIVSNKKDGIRAGAKKVFVLFIAGRDLKSDAAELTKQSEELRRLGVGLVVIALGPFVKKSDIEAMGMKSGNILYSETDAEIMSKLSGISQIVAAIEKKREQIDVVFIIGSSRNDDATQFELGKKIMVGIVKHLDVSPYGVRIAIIVYGTDARIFLQLDRSTSKENVIKTISGLTLPLGGDGLGKAIDLSRKEIFAVEANGTRTGVPKAAIVFVTRDIDVPASIAFVMLAQDNVKVKAIALSSSIGLDSLRSVSSTPKDAVLIASEGDLAQVLPRLVGSLVPGWYSSCILSSL